MNSVVFPAFIGLLIFCSFLFKNYLDLTLHLRENQKPLNSSPVHSPKKSQVLENLKHLVEIQNDQIARLRAEISSLKEHHRKEIESIQIGLEMGKSFELIFADLIRVKFSPSKSKNILLSKNSLTATNQTPKTSEHQFVLIDQIIGPKKKSSWVFGIDKLQDQKRTGRWIWIGLTASVPERDDAFFWEDSYGFGAGNAPFETIGGSNSNAAGIKWAPSEGDSIEVILDCSQNSLTLLNLKSQQKIQMKDLPQDRDWIPVAILYNSGDQITIQDFKMIEEPNQ